MRRTQKTAENLPVEETLPRSLHDIPGLGPIRVRALQKAGFHRLLDLRASTPEQLREVRGLSETKIEQILTYLNQFPERSLEKSSGAARTENKTKSDSDILLVRMPRNATVLQSESCRALRLVLALIMQPYASEYRGRLLRTMASFIHRSSILMHGVELDPALQERVLLKLKTARKLLISALDAPELDKKAQDSLSVCLQDANDSIQIL